MGVPQVSSSVPAAPLGEASLAERERTRDGDGAVLVEGLRRRELSARVRLVERYGAFIERLVAGALGVDADLADIVQEVFVRVLERVHQLRDPSALRSWIASLAVFTARGHIRRRRRWRWISSFAPNDLPELPAATAGPEILDLLRATYRILDTLSTEERLVFSLRFISQLELAEVAGACGVSLATVKRRLSRAEAAFVERAAADPSLRERLVRGRRWSFS